MFQVINTLEMNEKMEILLSDTEPKNTITIKNTNTLDEHLAPWTQWQKRRQREVSVNWII